MDCKISSGSEGDELDSCDEQGTGTESEDDESGGVDEVEGLSCGSHDDIDEEKEHADELDDSPDEAKNLSEIGWVFRGENLPLSWTRKAGDFSLEGTDGFEAGRLDVA